MIVILTALPSEAQPLIDYFGLKRCVEIERYKQYENADIRLLVCGIGKEAVATGIGFAAATLPSDEHHCFLNIGIAGHHCASIGSCHLVHKIFDETAEKHYFPSITFKLPGGSEDLITVSRPEETYQRQALYDMEGSAFFIAARRFAVLERIQLMKIVSDNQANPIEHIDRQFISRLITDNLSNVAHLVASMEALNTPIAAANPAVFNKLLQQFRFSRTQQYQLTELLQRWPHLLAESDIAAITKNCRSATEVNTKMAEKLTQTQVSLSVSSEHTKALSSHSASDGNTPIESR